MKNVYKTKDLAEGSFLLAKGKKLLSIEREGRTCWFMFDDSQQDCEKLINDFLFGNSTIHAKSFWDASLTLKHKIFA